MMDGMPDIEALLAGEAGEDLRRDYSPGSAYQAMRDARHDARAEERARDGLGDDDSPPAAAWDEVLRLGMDVLETRSKDFEVAAWVTEALVRQRGLVGLIAGARLLTGLLERHWDAGHPAPDEEGLEDRALVLGGLSGGEADGTLMQPLRRLALFPRASGGVLALHRLEASLDAAGIADEERRAQRFARGVVPLATLEAEARLAAPALRARLAELEAARAAWAAFAAALDDRFGPAAPSSRRVAELLDRLGTVLALLGVDAAPPATAPASPAAAPVAATVVPAATGPAAAAPPAGSITGREEALRTLERVGEFFQRTEPHSFLAWTLADAVRRARLPLPALLAEVMPDDAARLAMLTALGIRTMPEEEGG